MALVGGGGAGNVAGSNPSGTGTSLNYIRVQNKSFAYAYSGAINTDNVAKTLLDFTTGTEVIVGTFRPCYMVETDKNFSWSIKMNDELSAFMVFASANPNGSVQNEINLVIPPFTHVVITAVNAEDTAAKDVGCLLTGEVYA